MKFGLFLFIIGLAALQSCASSGYQPSYIISDTSLEEAAILLDKEEVK